MIHQLNMQGKDKVQVAIDRLKTFEPRNCYDYDDECEK